jgi:DNA-binding response OmpR family regulator
LLRRAKTEGTAPIRLLVVNNDSDGCELVARIFEAGGASVDRADDHQAALLALRSAEPRCSAVVLDFSSGVSSSLKLLDSIRHGDQEFRSLPVVILSATDQNRAYAFRSGADAYLVRPFHARDLVNEVETVLARSTEKRDAHRRAELEASQTP